MSESNDNQKSLSFRGVLSGDCECFCWDNVPDEDRAAIVKDHAADLRDNYNVSRLYPGNLMDKLGCKSNKLYRFTVTAELIESRGDVNESA